MGIQPYELEDLIEGRMSQYEATNPLFAVFMRDGPDERSLVQGAVNMVLEDVGDMLKKKHVALFAGLVDNPNLTLRRGFFAFALTIYPKMRQYIIDNSPPSPTLAYYLQDILPIMAKGLSDGRPHTITLRAFARLALHEYTALVELAPVLQPQLPNLRHCYSTS